MSGLWRKCLTCGVGIWLTNEQHDVLSRTHQAFYCLYGHTQHFTSKRGIQGELDEVRRERDRLKQNAAYLAERVETAERRAEHNRRSANAYKGAATKIKKRVVAGVCPCCNRHFRELERHMASKHPDFPTASIVPKADEALQ